MQKFLHDEKNFLQPKNFCHLCQNSFLYTTFDIQSFWKNYKIGIKNFCMVRENFCMLLKSAPLILQPRKTPLLWNSTTVTTLTMMLLHTSKSSSCALHIHESARIFALLIVSLKEEQPVRLKVLRITKLGLFFIFTRVRFSQEKQ